MSNQSNSTVFKTVGFRISRSPIKQDWDNSKDVWFLDAVQVCDTIPGEHLDNITSGTKAHCQSTKASIESSGRISTSLKRIVETEDRKALEAFCCGRTYQQIRNYAIYVGVDLDALEELLGRI